jgi:hypothetical protein
MCRLQVGVDGPREVGVEASAQVADGTAKSAHQAYLAEAGSFQEEDADTLDECLACDSILNVRVEGTREPSPDEADEMREGPLPKLAEALREQYRLVEADDAQVVVDMKGHLVDADTWWPSCQK